MEEWEKVGKERVTGKAAEHDRPRNNIKEVSEVNLHHHKGGVKLECDLHAVDEDGVATARADSHLLRS